MHGAVAFLRNFVWFGFQAGSGSGLVRGSTLLEDDFAVQHEIPCGGAGHGE